MTLNQFNQLDEMEQVETLGREEKAKFDGFCYKIDGFCNISPSTFALSEKQRAPCWANIEPVNR